MLLQEQIRELEEELRKRATILKTLENEISLGKARERELNSGSDELKIKLLTAISTETS
jgi:hypothetical protein